VEEPDLYKADQIIALGGGSIIDAAKIMKLMYEFPEANIEELAVPFLDIRKCVVQYPTEGTNQVRLISISTSGTGSGVTSFAVLTDKQRGFKVTLADYSLTPDVDIVDPQFVMSMPKGPAVDTGVDCLTHAPETGVSIFASPYKDSNAMQAARMVSKYLPVSYENRRTKRRSSCCIRRLASLRLLSRMRPWA
jgi:acetaldehyde dehydrogenase / alcohol dehydrogenase